MKRKFAVTLMLLAVFCLVASSAFAGLVVSVKVAPGQADVAYTADGAEVQAGTQLLMQVWASVVGADQIANNDKLQTVSGGIKLTGAGALALDTTNNPYGYAAPFAESTAVPTVTETQLGLGASTAAAGPMWWRAAALQVDTELNQSYLLGTFKYTAGAAGTKGEINYLKPGAAVGTLTFVMDGSSKTGLAASGGNITTAGTVCTVTAVPEPSTLVLLGLGALALVFVRRRK